MYEQTPIQETQTFSSKTIKFDYPKVITKFTMKQQGTEDLLVIGKLYNNQITLQRQSSKSEDSELLQKDANDDESKKYKIIFDFQTIFSILRDNLTEEEQKKHSGRPYGIKIQKYSDNIQLHSQCSAEIQKWKILLTEKLNQRNFHQIFKPLKKIGKGNFASVYLVHKHQNNRQYAAKAFSKEIAFGEDRGKQALENQIKIMRELDHKYLMKLEGVYETENSIYMCVEYLGGGVLFQRIKNRYAFTNDEIKTIMRSLLEGIVAMHQRDIMHRDLKPQNIIFRDNSSFQCVIADFGLATYSDISNYIFTRCGTPGYVAPEISNIKDKSEQYDPVCDIFSLGVIFYILLLGKSPFPGVQCDEVLRQNRQCIIDFEQPCFSKLSSLSLDLLKKMMEKDPKKRITASQGLDHYYFGGDMDMLSESLSIKYSHSKQESCQSPLMITKNPKRKRNLKLRDDSCIKFKMRDDMQVNQESQQFQDLINSPANAVRRRGKSRKAKTLYPTSNFKV